MKWTGVNRVALAAGAAMMLAGLSSTGAIARSEDNRWLHVTIDQAGKKVESVRVNLPLALAEKIVPLIKDENLRDGKIKLGEDHSETVDLRAIWKAVRETEDAEFVTIEGTEGNVRVAKRGDFLIVKIRGDGEGKPERVDAKLPLSVVDALFSGEEDELNVSAALQVLASYDGELVSVNDDKTTIRVWIDGHNTAEE